MHVSEGHLIELRGFGTLHLHSADGDRGRSILAQPKRTAVLLYLALARPRGFQSKHAIFGLLWPELPESRARVALNKAVHHLRKELGHEIVLRRGDGAVGLNWERFDCDVAAFERALEAGEAEAALALYAGDVAQAFALEDAPAFDHWLDTVRERYRREAIAAARELAEQAAADGDVGATVHWVGRVMELDPESEATLRWAVTLLVRSGDRGAAAQLVERTRSRLAANELQFSRTTEQSIAALLGPGQPQDMMPSATPSHHARGVHATSAARDVPGTGKVGSIRGGRPGAELLSAAAARRDPGHAPAVSQPERIPPAGDLVVLPFAYDGPALRGHLGRSVATVLSTLLDGVDGLRSVSGHGRLAESDGGALDDAAATAVGTRLGARFVVHGSIAELGGQLHISAAFHDVVRVAAPVARVTASGKGKRIDELVDLLARRLIAGRYPGPASRLTALAAEMAPSMPVFAAYLEGERELRACRAAPAIAALERAIEQAPDFALAYYRLATARAWGLRSDEAVEAAERAAELSGTMGERDRLLVHGHLALRRGDAVEAERIFRSILSGFPDDVEARLQLGKVIFYHRLPRGYPSDEARRLFVEVAEAQPDNVEALLHLSRIAAARNDVAELERIARKLEALGAGERRLEVAALRAVAAGDRESMADVLTELAAAGEAILIAVAGNLGDYTAFPQDLGMLDALLELFTHAPRSDASRAIGHILTGQVRVAFGRWKAASACLREAARFASGPALIYHGYYATCPHLPVPASELQELRTALLDWEPDAAPSALHPILAAHAGAYPILRSYLLALISARLGEIQAARDFAREIESHATSSTSTAQPFAGLPHALYRGALAYAAAAAGETDQALAHIARGWLVSSRILMNLSPFYFQLHEHYLQAALLHRRGALEDAFIRYGAFNGLCHHNWVYRAVAHLERARILETRGETEAAERERQSFARWWEEADTPAAELEQRLNAPIEHLLRVDIPQ